MAVSKNMAELEKMLHDEMKRAMQEASNKMYKDLYEETIRFYDEGSPKIYKRTGNLGKTPRVTKLKDSFATISFEAYLDTSYSYPDGDRPSMFQVLTLANDGVPWTTTNGKEAIPTVGKKYFWEAAEQRMEQTFIHTFEKHFKG